MHLLNGKRAETQTGGLGLIIIIQLWFSKDNRLENSPEGDADQGPLQSRRAQRDSLWAAVYSIARELALFIVMVFSKITVQPEEAVEEGCTTTLSPLKCVKASLSLSDELMLQRAKFQQNSYRPRLEKAADCSKRQGKII